MRITGGILKNRKIIAPKDASKLRPTTDKLRSAFFSSIGGIEGAAFLDLFAGTGAVGLEAISRGADRVTFLDIDVRCIEKNISVIPAGVEFNIISSDILQAGKRLTGRVFDIIYIDPPYSAFSPDIVLMQLKGNLATDTLIGYEESVRSPFLIPDGFNIMKERRYGETVLRYIKQNSLR
ncbi:MAG: 16S rRNA (guanine(966)-N(2))-methyltransferase RsmD [Deferribacteraceae bacterium]|jgi:16S rRNA (guanine966-N2)-methyltransferase|nr:16S rRNA (guanine(966)-N(2))-methyltransferase RsmD [Deferribacteraceae bacterium]